MGGNRVNWTALALAISLAMAFACVATALLAHGGHLFAAALAAGLGIAASAAYAGLALRAAERRLGKLSEELTIQSQRLVRLEARRESAEPTPLGEDVEAIRAATGALGGALEVQDTRLRALELDIARLRDATSRSSNAQLRPERLTEIGNPALRHAEEQPQAASRSTHGRGPSFERPAARAPQDEAVGNVEDKDAAHSESASREAVAPTSSARQTTREDFARAASTILGRLAPEPLHVIQAPAEDAVVEDLEAGRLELWLQPIVTLPQRRLRLYAAQPQLRDRNGQPLSADALRPILARRRRLERLDAFALSQALLVAAHLASRNRDTAVALQLSRESIASGPFLEGAERRLAGDRAAASRLVLAFDHAEIEAASAQEAAALGRLRGLGAGLALTTVPSLDQDWASLARRGFGHAMLEAGKILGPRPHATTAFLVAEAARAGVALVATGIERERQVPDLLDFEVPFAMGDAIAPARPVRAEVLAPEASPVQPVEIAEQDGPAPFRAFLRRAG
jgi:cyclic-di-GMP phosphodiesterase TipF (flagellum assembly factor)